MPLMYSLRILLSATTVICVHRLSGMAELEVIPSVSESVADTLTDNLLFPG